MKAYAEKPSGNQHQAAAHEATQQNRADNEVQFIDNRAETAGLRQLQKAADNSPRASEFAQLKAMMNSNPHSAARQSLPAMINNSPRQVAQRRQHRRVQGVSMVAPSSFSGMKYIGKPLGRITQLINFPEDSIGSINEKWTFDVGKDTKKEVKGSFLQEKILEIAKSFEKKPTSFRLGSFFYKRDGTLERNESADYDEDHGLNELPEKTSSNEEDMDRMEGLIKLYIKGTLTDAGQIQYITENADHIFKKHTVVIDVDCQFDRWGDVAFHKDSRGTTAFVNLTFNNEEKLQGTDYYEDLEGDSGLEKQLPKEMKKDIEMRRLRMKLNKDKRADSENDDIKSPELQPYGRISFSDPNLYHSTPLMRSRKKPTGKETREFLINYILQKQAKKRLDSIICYLKNFLNIQENSLDVEAAKHWINNIITSKNQYSFNSYDNYKIFFDDDFFEFLEDIGRMDNIKNEKIKELKKSVDEKKFGLFLDEVEAMVKKEKVERLRDKYANYLEYDYHLHGRDKMSKMTDEDLEKKAIATAKRKRELDSRLKDGLLTQDKLDKQQKTPRTFIRTWVRFVPNK